MNGERLDAARAFERRLRREQRHLHRSAGAHEHHVVFVADDELVEVRAQPQHQTANAAVADENVRPQAQHEPRQPALEAQAQDERRVGARIDGNEGIGWTADAPPRIRRERFVEGHARTEVRPQRSRIVGREQTAHGRVIRRRRATLRARRRTGARQRRSTPRRA
jgi:hypothetical protein